MFDLDSGRAYVPPSMLEAKLEAATKWTIAEHDCRLLTAMASLGDMPYCSMTAFASFQDCNLLRFAYHSCNEAARDL